MALGRPPRDATVHTSLRGWGSGEKLPTPRSELRFEAKIQEDETHKLSTNCTREQHRALQRVTACSLGSQGHTGPSTHNLGLSQHKKGMKWEGDGEGPLLLSHVAPGAS